MSLKLNGIATKEGKKFTQGSINYIMSVSGIMSAKAIANVLHRSEKSVRRKAEKLKLSLKTLK